MKPSLFADDRGGVENVLYIILVACIAIVAIPGVRHFTASAERSFQSSTTRFDKPGTYCGGDIQTGGNRNHTPSDWYLVPVGNHNELERCNDFADGMIRAEYEAWKEQNSSEDAMSDWGYYWGYVRCRADRDIAAQWSRPPRPGYGLPACGPDAADFYYERGRNRLIGDCMSAVSGGGDGSTADSDRRWSKLICAVSAFYLVYLPTYIASSPVRPPTFPTYPHGVSKPRGTPHPVFEYEDWAQYCE